jgi:hypothetical protein
MRREEYEDRGYVPDYVISQRELKRRLGIAEYRMIRDIDTSHRNNFIIDLGIKDDRRVKYVLPETEFKEKLGITDYRSVVMVLASVWDRDIQVSLYDTHPEKAIRIGRE